MPKKYSRKREAILTAIKSTDTHPSASWIYSVLKPEIPDLSLGTVYRNISEFRDDGVIRSVGVVDGEERFDGDTSEHAHFICEICGCVMDIDVSGDKLVRMGSVAKKAGLEISHYDLTFYGHCPDCI